MTPDDKPMISHWWWRPGWKAGRSFYTWHVTFHAGSPMAELADRYRPTLQRFEGLDVLRTDELHLTVQGLGFVGEITEYDVTAIVESSQVELAELSPRIVTAGPAHVDSETVQVALHPADQLAEIRTALRRGIATVWGSDNVPEHDQGFRPHITLAYSNTVNRRAEIVAAVEEVGSPTVTLPIERVSLIRLHRDNSRYEWDDVAVARLTHPGNTEGGR